MGLKRIRFYVGRLLMEFGLFIMPFEALAEIKWNDKFLRGVM